MNEILKVINYIFIAINIVLLFVVLFIALRRLLNKLKYKTVITKHNLLKTKMFAKSLEKKGLLDEAGIVYANLSRSFPDFPDLYTKSIEVRTDYYRKSFVNKFNEIDFLYLESKIQEREGANFNGYLKTKYLLLNDYSKNKKREYNIFKMLVQSIMLSIFGIFSLYFIGPYLHGMYKYLLFYPVFVHLIINYLYHDELKLTTLRKIVGVSYTILSVFAAMVFVLPFASFYLNQYYLKYDYLFKGLMISAFVTPYFLCFNLKFYFITFKNETLEYFAIIGLDILNYLIYALIAVLVFSLELLIPKFNYSIYLYSFLVIFLYFMFEWIPLFGSMKLLFESQKNYGHSPYCYFDLNRASKDGVLNLCEPLKKCTDVYLYLMDGIKDIKLKNDDVVKEIRLSNYFNYESLKRFKNLEKLYLSDSIQAFDLNMLDTHHLKYLYINDGLKSLTLKKDALTIDEIVIKNNLNYKIENRTLIEVSTNKVLASYVDGYYRFIL